MTSKFIRSGVVAFATAAVLMLALAPAAQAANVVIVNLDVGTGLGYDDPTPATPEGGNPGTTLGELRLNAANFAAQIWGDALDSPATIFVLATFQPLGCTPTSGTLGSAGTTFVFRDFAPGPPTVIPGTWYHSSLADKLAGGDLNPGFGDIFSQFNGRIGVDPNCLVGLDWYYGLDNNQGPNDIDFLSVVLHEIGHGLGFANFVNEATGTLFLGLPDIYTVFSEDNTLGLTWDVMTDAERQFSAVNTGNLVWNGGNVTAQAPNFLGPRPVLDVTGVGLFDAQAASFGPALTVAGTTGTVVLADDGTGVTTDGCEPLVNDVSGDIALIDRGACSFVQKVLNAQNAGAIGVVIANNVAGGPAPMGGSSPDVVIPSVGITLDQGNDIKAALPTTATIGLSPARLAGADNDGRVRLYAPSVVALGSSVSHFDTAATPNLLMEPFINGDLQSATTLDLTPYLLADEGWMLLDSDGDGVPNVGDECRPSDTQATVVIDGCDSGVANQVFDNGCTITDLVLLCAESASNHGQFVSCASGVTNGLKGQGIISGGDKGSIQSCAAQSSLP